MFFKGSRYENVETNMIRDDKGRVIRYKKVRFIPQTEPLQNHIVMQGDRLDNLAYKYFDDPERFWKICDANLALWPDDLLKETGRNILIPSAED
jgi:hypothetical protein